MAQIHNNLTSLIGNTPLLEVHNIEKAESLKARVLVKLEFFNPGGSVKDRIALEMIEDAESKGVLAPGAVIIEPTSGNTGIGLAAVAAAKGYKAILTLPDTMSVERRNILKAYGVELVLTEGAKGMAGAIEKAAELAKEIPGSFIPDQFSNPANAAAHYKSKIFKVSFYLGLTAYFLYYVFLSYCAECEWHHYTTFLNASKLVYANFDAKLLVSNR